MGVAMEFFSSKKIAVIFTIGFTCHAIAAVTTEEPKPVIVIHEIRNETPFEMVILQEQNLYKPVNPDDPKTKYIRVLESTEKAITWHEVKPATKTASTIYQKKIPLFGLNNIHDKLLIWHERQVHPSARGSGDQPIAVVDPSKKQGNLSLKITEKNGSTPENPKIEVTEIWHDPEPAAVYQNNIINSSNQIIKVFKKSNEDFQTLETYTVGPQRIKSTLLRSLEKPVFGPWPHHLEFYATGAEHPFFIYYPPLAETNMSFFIKEVGGKLTAEPQSLSQMDLKKIKSNFEQGRNP
jgi:hypothetical protein